MKQILKCGQFFSGKDEHVEKNVAVVVEGNRIVQVAPIGEVDEAGAEVIDLSDKFVMPGLIDAHVHVNMDGAPSMKVIENQTIGEITLLSMVRAQKDLMAGFTTIRDEGGVEFTDVALRDAINAGNIVGPRMLVSGISISSVGGHGDSAYYGGEVNKSFAMVVSGPDDARRAARFTFKHGADQLKLMATGGVMSAGSEPGAPELTFEEMKAALDIANTRGLISSAHAHGATGIKNAIRAGITSIEHGMMIDDEGMQMLKDYGVYLIPTIIAAYQIIEMGEKSGIPPFAVRKAAQCLEKHGENLRKMIAMGIKIGFGSDSGTPFNFHGKQGFEFELMTRYGFTPEQTLLAATKVNSEMMKMQDKIGTIEENRLADIVAFDRSPIEDITVMMNCSFVMKDGVVYKQ